MYRYYLALRFMVSRPINLLGIIGVTLGVWSLIVVVSIFSGYIRQVKQQVEVVSADIVVQRLSNRARYSVARRVIRADPNVASCSPRLVWGGLLHPRNTAAPRRIPGALPRNGPYVSISGIDPVAEAATTGFGDWLTTGTTDDRRAHIEKLGARRGWILLGELRIEATKLSRGAPIMTTLARVRHVRAPSEPPNTGRTPAGAKPRARSRVHTKIVTRFGKQEFALAGGFATKHAGFDTLTAFVHIDDLRQLIAEDNPDYVNEIAIKLIDRSPVAVQQTRRRLTAALRIQPAFSFPVPHLQIAGGREHTRLVAVEHQRGLMKLVLFVIMVVAGFLVYATLSMMVTEKVHDIGVLSALGATRRGVLQVFLTCGLAIALTGTLLGIVSGCVTSIYLDSFNSWLKRTWDVDLFPTDIYYLPHVPYHLDPWWITMVGGASLLFGVVAAAIPAARAMRNDPMDALRNG